MAPKKAEKATKEAQPVANKDAEAEEKKRKAEEPAEEEPAAKKEAKEEELEKDAPGDKRAKVKETVGFNAADTTLNVVPTFGGKLLTSVNEGGMQYLVAGARANVGIKSGRYMYEVKIFEQLNIAEASQWRMNQRGPPQRLLHIGFSPAGASLILGDSDGGVHFSADGSYCPGKQRIKDQGARFKGDSTIGILLNLDAKSENTNTISLFVNGVRASKPQKLPETLVGKTLFPHISFRSMSVQVNMGPQPTKALPFSCRTVQDAAAADVVVAAEKAPKDGKYDVVLPVGFPDEGTFEWLNSFLEKNPSYVELSDRKLQDWAASSGFYKPRQQRDHRNSPSYDKPIFTYGLPSMDNGSLQRVVNSLAPLTPRNYVVMEVKANLISTERAKVLKRFGSGKFKKSALVVMGEPKEDFKKKVKAHMLKVKQEKSDALWKIKKQQQDAKKARAAQAKELAEKKKAEEEEKAKKKAEAEEEEKAKKKAEEESKDAEKKDEEKKDEEKKKEDKKEEEKKEEEDKKEEEKKDGEKTEEEKKTDEAEPKEEEMEDLGDEPPKVELDEEEEKTWFMPKGSLPDIVPSAMSKVYASFSIPEEAEGFDAVKFEWETESGSKEYLRKWILQTKVTTRIDDLAPSAYFQEKLAAWTKLSQDWQSKQKAFQSAGDKKDETKVSDIFAVEDVNDIGNGEPLYSNFGPEDWALMQLRAELHLLQDAFKKDVNDPDRTNIPEQHLNFYYKKYFHKNLNLKQFSLEKTEDMIALVKDAVRISEDGMLTSQLSDDVESMDVMAKMTESSRKDRQRRLDAGDETARVKFAQAAPPPVPSPAPVPSAPPMVSAPQAQPQQWNQQHQQQQQAPQHQQHQQHQQYPQHQQYQQHHKGYGDRGDKGGDKGGNKGYGDRGDKGGNKGYGDRGDKGYGKNFGKDKGGKDKGYGKNFGKDKGGCKGGFKGGKW